jgi:hypothetical protein
LVERCKPFTEIEGKLWIMDRQEFAITPQIVGTRFDGISIEFAPRRVEIVTCEERSLAVRTKILQLAGVVRLVAQRAFEMG